MVSPHPPLFYRLILVLSYLNLLEDQYCDCTVFEYFDPQINYLFLLKKEIHLL